MLTCEIHFVINHYQHHTSVSSLPASFVWQKLYHQKIITLTSVCCWVIEVILHLKSKKIHILDGFKLTQRHDITAEIKNISKQDNILLFPSCHRCDQPVGHLCYFAVTLITSTQNHYQTQKLLVVLHFLMQELKL